MIINRLSVLVLAAYVTGTINISYKFGSWKVQKQGARGCNVWWGLASCLPDGTHLFAPSHSWEQRERHAPSMSSYKDTNPIMSILQSRSNHAPNSITLGIRASVCECEGNTNSWWNYGLQKIMSCAKHYFISFHLHHSYISLYPHLINRRSHKKIKSFWISHVKKTQQKEFKLICKIILMNKLKRHKNTISVSIK